MAPVEEGSVAVRLVIIFDQFPEEIGWAISSSATEEMVASRPIGFYPIGTVSIEHVIVTEIGDMLGGLKGAIVNFVVKKIKKEMLPS